MKMFTLFGKTPQYQRFNYTPRFYDPIKEEIKEREKRIREELKIEQEKKSEEDMMGYRSRMAGSFHAARRRSAPSRGVGTGILRLGILLYLVLLVVSYLQWGNVALYSVFLFIPLYFYLRLKRS